MPKFEKGDMWSIFGKTDLFLITTNPIIKKDGSVVMGRGIAKQAAERFPFMPYDFAKSIRFAESVNMMRNVGPIGEYDGQPVGYFMVKNHWREPAVLDIIEDSVRAFLHTVDWTYTKTRIDLNFPGIGNGKLKREDVLPIINQLPDNVHIWEYGRE